METSKFVEFAMHSEALQFGQFTLKSGRISPYFFNAGKFNTGEHLAVLGEFYAQRLIDSGIDFDMLFGPAYKGIPLATAISVSLHQQHQRSVAVAFNRKEAKTHGEAGLLIGAPLAGKIVITDDVITAGTAIRESFDIIKDSDAEVVAVIVALDRQEKGPNGASAIQEIEQQFQIPVLAIAGLNDLLSYVQTNMAEQQQALTEYRNQYGV
ncbi:MAG: orotate phosphoribosyltransferase [Gammaproteobacteria bacterium]|jgi:orotate phosphoribosyltransferase|nr:orotate phosphoribosyltransferase [Gammaproteobacteria bacterium]